MRFIFIFLIQLTISNFASGLSRVHIITNNESMITDLSVIGDEEIYTTKGDFYEVQPVVSQDKSKFYETLNRSNIKFIDFGLNKEQEESLISNPQGTDIFNQFKSYFVKEFGIEGAIITDNQRTEVYQNSSSICDIMLVDIKISDFVQQFLAVGFFPMEATFTFCDQTKFTFETQLNVNGNTVNFQRSMRKGLDNLFNDKPKMLKDNDPLEIPNGEIILPMGEASMHFSGNLNDFEGAYELISISSQMSIKKFGVIKKADKYIIFHIDNNYLTNDWKFGEYRGEFEELRENTVFKGFILGNYKTNVEGVMILNENGIIEFEDITNGDKFKFIKYDF